MKQGNIQSYIQKLFLGIAFSFLFSFTGVAQMENPVHWSYSTKKISADQVDLIMTAQIDKDWHVYTQFFPAGGPIRLTFNFEKSKDYKLVGKVKETPKPHKEHDEIFGIDVAYTKGKAIFTQTINALSKEPFTIKVSIEGQACYELDGKCIVVEGENIFNIDGNTSAAGVDNQAGDTTSVKVDSDTTSTQENDSNLFKVPVQVIHVNPNNNQQETSNNTPAEQSLLIFFLVALGAGLLGAVTPCVFPMIPMTVTFFMNTSGSRSKTLKLALFYGFSIVALYTAIGAIVALTSVNSNFANQISTNWIVNLVFFLLFMVFAASFFGMFELTLPGSLATKADQQVDKGGYVGAFFMALTLVIVSFSCTGPIIGVILVQAAGGAVLKPILGMLGFSLTFALPFTLFAAFPSLLQKLPKSGGWLNAVKVVLGFVVLALGMKFLSAVDMGLQLNILDREVFIAIWIVLFAMLGFYLLGKLKFAHDSDLPYISVPRLLMAIISFAFVVYLLPGLVGAPLKGVSAFLPSETTHDFDLKAIIRDNSGGTAEKPQNLCDQPKYADFLKLPH